MSINRGCGSHRGIYLCAVAALGLALSGCGGGGSAPAASAAQTSAPSQASSSAPPAAAAPGSSTSSSGGSGSTASNPPTATVGVITINWVAPTQNVDGTPLTNLAGYNIHYGTTPGSYTQTISVSNPGIATYVVSNLSPGTYYFSVAAVNATGTESPLSSEVSTTVN